MNDKLWNHASRFECSVSAERGPVFADQPHSNLNWNFVKKEMNDQDPFHEY